MFADTHIAPNLMKINRITLRFSKNTAQTNGVSVFYNYVKQLNCLPQKTHTEALARLMTTSPRGETKSR